mmetsp:Transcript_81203/g.143184  ORF Transcript_81203/g.143184 Transcript_81203/m.143184 type:complete len:236 (-) Transcript_81203:179-886(-)
MFFVENSRLRCRQCHPAQHSHGPIFHAGAVEHRRLSNTAVQGRRCHNLTAHPALYPFRRTHRQRESCHQEEQLHMSLPGDVASLEGLPICQPRCQTFQLRKAVRHACFARRARTAYSGQVLQMTETAQCSPCRDELAGAVFAVQVAAVPSLQHKCVDDAHSQAGPRSSPSQQKPRACRCEQRTSFPSPASRVLDPQPFQHPDLHTARSKPKHFQAARAAYHTQASSHWSNSKCCP